MTPADGWGLVPFAAGLLGGVAAGYAVRRARLCSFGAAEALWLRGDALRLRAFGLALAVAVAGTQALVLAGLLDLGDVRILGDVLPVGGALLGGVVFGVGMAFVGTCAFGALLRLGGGDLRALVVLVVFGAVAWATLLGSLAWTGRLLGRLVVPLARPDLAGLLAGPGAPGRAIVTAAVLLALLGWVGADRRLRRSPRLLLAGGALGLAAVAGWVATGPLSDPFDSQATPPHSLSFVGSVARLLYWVAVDPGSRPGLGTGSVLGAVLGAWLAARRAREFRWEAFDDHQEMARHLVGAVLMGLGGVWAGGCTIGQGITAGSVLAPGWLLVVGGILLGARFGIAVLVEGGLRASWRFALGRAHRR